MDCSSNKWGIVFLYFVSTQKRTSNEMKKKVERLVFNRREEMGLCYFSKNWWNLMGEKHWDLGHNEKGNNAVLLINTFHINYFWPLVFFSPKDLGFNYYYIFPILIPFFSSTTILFVHLNFFLNLLWYILY